MGRVVTVNCSPLPESCSGWSLDAIRFGDDVVR